MALVLLMTSYSVMNHDSTVNIRHNVYAPSFRTECKQQEGVCVTKCKHAPHE